MFCGSFPYYYKFIIFKNIIFKNSIYLVLFLRSINLPIKFLIYVFDYYKKITIKVSHSKTEVYFKISMEGINLKIIKTPIVSKTLQNLKTGDQILISGTILTGRDAALPRLVKLVEKGESPISLEGAVIMHTAVSPAGIAPTSSNKTEIENSIIPLSKAGVKIHMGKGALSNETVDALKRYDSIFVVTPPAAALLTSKVLSSEVVAFPEEGMESLHRLEIKDFPAIIAVAHGESIY